MYSNVALVRDLWSYLKAYKGRFFLAMCARVFADIAWLYPPFALATIVTFFSSYTPGDSLHIVYVSFGLLFLSVVMRYGGIYIAKRVGFGVSERLVFGAVLRSIKHLFRLDMSWHEKENTGNKFKCVERGAQSIDKIIRIWLNNLIEILINCIGVIFILLQFEVKIAVALVVFIVTFYILAHAYRKKAVAVSQIVNEKEEHISGLLFESINNVRSVKAMSMAPKILRLLSQAIADILGSIDQRIFWAQSGNVLRQTYAHVFRLAVFGFIVWGIIEGRYEVGFLILFNSYFTSISTSITELADASQEIAIAKYAIFRMQKILHTPVIIDLEEGKRQFPAQWREIIFRNVSFSYGAKQVLDDVSFTVKRGERVGIVGLSGAGKSTLFKLLLKEHEEYTGGIYFDGTPLREVSKKDYYKRLAVVLQETDLFNVSLRDNITITNSAKEKDLSLLGKALTISHVKDFSSKLPAGVDTIVGEKGVRLSGGEKQRVGIARAVFKEPEILLLDEATSHLDIESEEKIRDSLHHFFESVTAIVIAHRLTTIKEMDRIIVLEDGKIVESGTFADLQKKKGRFYDLWEKQKL